MNQSQRFLARAGAAIGALATPVVALAAVNPLQTAGNNLTNFQLATCLKTQDLPTLVGNIINAVLGIIGLVLLIYLIYGGFLWMTAGGDEGNVKKAKDMIKNAIIGLVVIMAAVSISSFVIGALSNAT